MCRASEEGGRRCPAHNPESRKAQRRAVVVKKKHPREAKDVDCTNSPDCENGVIRVRDEQGSYISQALCQMCGGLGYLNDAAGRIASLPRARKAHGSSEASIANQAFKALHGAAAVAEAKAAKAAAGAEAKAAKAAKAAAVAEAKAAKASLRAQADDVAKVAALRAHLKSTAASNPANAAFLKAAEGCSAQEVLESASERRLPRSGECGCVDGKREVFDGHTDEVTVIDCLLCDDNATVEVISVA